MNSSSVTVGRNHKFFTSYSRKFLGSIFTNEYVNWL